MAMLNNQMDPDGMLSWWLFFPASPKWNDIRRDGHTSAWL